MARGATQHRQAEILSFPVVGLRMLRAIACDDLGAIHFRWQHRSAEHRHDALVPCSEMLASYPFLILSLGSVGAALSLDPAKDAAKQLSKLKTVVEWTCINIKLTFQFPLHEAGSEMSGCMPSFLLNR